MSETTSQRAPLDVATAAKRRRDFAGEIGALTAADRDLTRRPWFPLRPGDVVLAYLPPQEGVPGYGTTYVAVDEGKDPAGNPLLRQVSADLGLLDTPDDGRPALPEYVLVYNAPKATWELESPDDDTGADLAPWTSPDYHIGPQDLDGAKAWAVRQIATIEGEGRRVAGWKPWPKDDSADLEAVFEDEEEEPPAGPVLDSFYDLWFEVGAALLTVIRAGKIVHGVPIRTRESNL